MASVHVTVTSCCLGKGYLLHTPPLPDIVCQHTMSQRDKGFIHLEQTSNLASRMLENGDQFARDCVQLDLNKINITVYIAT